MGPRVEDESRLWMSDLPDQLQVLQAIEEHVRDLDVGADGLAAALGVACGRWGGVHQNLLGWHVADRPQSGQAAGRPRALETRAATSEHCQGRLHISGAYPQLGDLVDGGCGAALTGQARWPGA